MTHENTEATQSEYSTGVMISRNERRWTRTNNPSQRRHLRTGVMMVFHKILWTWIRLEWVLCHGYGEVIDPDRGVIHHARTKVPSPWATLCLFLLLPLILTACSIFGGSVPTTTQHSNAQPTQTSPGIQLGVQPCPSTVTPQWNPGLHLPANQVIEHITCGNLLGISTLQALATVRHTSSDHILDIFIYTNITSSSPTQLFTLHGLLHGDAKISGYNTLLTGQSDPHSSLNQKLSPAQFEQDLFREFKWSNHARTFEQVAFSGIFPDLTRFQAEREQVQVNNGQGFQQWRLDVVKSTQIFANIFLNWSLHAPATVLSGGGLHDYKAVVQVQNAPSAGGIIRLSFIRLEGNNNGGIWEVMAVEAEGISITAPQNGQMLRSPITVAGSNKAFAGKTTTIKILDHTQTDVGHATLGTNGKNNFSSSVPYTATFQGNTQEGIVALYVYNANNSIATVVMVKALLSA